MRICGVDDAGRGPVIGPLVIAGIRIEEERLDQLRSLGVKDSKKLSPEARMELSTEIPKIVDEYHIVELEASHLDLVVNRSPKFQGLNLLEASAMADVIEKLKPHIAYVDASDTRCRVFLWILSKGHHSCQEEDRDLGEGLAAAATPSEGPAS